MNRKWVGCCIAILLFGAVTPVVGGITDDSARGEFNSPAADTVLAPSTVPNESTPVHEILTFDRTPDRDGHVRLTVDYELHESIETLQVWVPFDGEVTSTTGMEREGVTYVWEQGNPAPSMTIVFEALNPTIREDGFTEGDGWSFVDARVMARATSATEGRLDGYGIPDWRYRETRFVNGEGYVGRQVAYLGAHSTVHWETDDEQFTLVLPDSTDRDGSEVRDTLTEASTGYIPSRDTVGVTVFALDERFGGLKFSVNPDTAVSMTAPVDSPENIWVHEYVHVRQWFNTEDDLEWSPRGRRSTSLHSKRTSRAESRSRRSTTPSSPSRISRSFSLNHGLGTSTRTTVRARGSQPPSTHESGRRPGGTTHSVTSSTCSIGKPVSMRAC
ncbi:hypothetical protein [Haloarchaeobius iranensis]|uniref:hypothetical protein n=1 Tax=Haloarchaeobius iranensis TaxID=996166 RepID=UPI0011133950|nr:hypothetical protein [Haloarchaeobius iranensis]